jgi:hypothetical protein
MLTNCRRLGSSNQSSLRKDFIGLLSELVRAARGIEEYSAARACSASDRLSQQRMLEARYSGKQLYVLLGFAADPS